ncbi:hypothetical protein AB432_021810 [Brevibacillus brevis]|uniref:Uncharacterized protein n=1 Tax=Brevibacillus brevis TaxID=1393 RepID=A0A2Z4MLV5_BREBE|nr:hypothetical protein AB432_021810 [Brevibacillus brevis]
MFRFFHCASVGAPKIFAYFSCFLTSEWVFKWLLKIENKQSVLATFEVQPSFAVICGQKKYNVLTAT